MVLTFNCDAFRTVEVKRVFFENISDYYRSKQMPLADPITEFTLHMLTFS